MMLPLTKEHLSNKDTFLGRKGVLAGGGLLYTRRFQLCFQKLENRRILVTTSIKEFLLSHTHVSTEVKENLFFLFHHVVISCSHF